MEFGVFVGMYHPNHRREAGETEQDVLRAELDVVQAADRAGFKYVWVTEHHFLDEYSHLSANEAFLAYALAITERIHIGSGIFNITPPVNHPARVAEKVAMLDQLAPGRFEFGTGRGSSSVEVFGFGIDSMDTTRDMFDEALPEIVKMMGPDEYGPTTASSSRCRVARCCRSRSRCRTRRSGWRPGRRARSRRRPAWASACCASASPAPRR